MTVELLDYATIKPDGRPAAWSDFQAEFECGVPVSSGFVMLPPAQAHPLADRPMGRYTCKQAHSALGYNESVEAIQKPPAAGWVAPGQRWFYSLSFVVPAEWRPPRGWGLSTQFYQQWTFTTFGGPSVTLDFGALGAANPTNRTGWMIRVLAGNGPSSVDGFQRHYFWNDLVAGELTDLVLDVRWEWDPAKGGITAYRRRRGVDDAFQTIVTYNGPTLQRVKATGEVCPMFYKQGLYRGSMCKTEKEATGSGGATQIGSLVCGQVGAAACRYGALGAAPDNTILQAGLQVSSTLAEAYGFYAAAEPPPAPTPPDHPTLPPVEAGFDRYGVTDAELVAYDQPTGLTADRWRAVRLTDTPPGSTIWVALLTSTPNQLFSVAARGVTGAMRSDATAYADGLPDPAPPGLVGNLDLAVCVDVETATKTVKKIWWRVMSDRPVGAQAFTTGIYDDEGTLLGEESETGAQAPLAPGWLLFDVDINLTPVGPSTDIDRPEVVVAVARGAILEVQLSEPISAGQTGLWHVELDGVPTALVGVTARDSEVTMSLYPPAEVGDVVTYTYEPYVDNRVEDLAGNPLAPIDDGHALNVTEDAA